MEEGCDDIYPAIAQLAMVSDDRKIPRFRNRAIYCRETRDLILEILLVCEPGPGGQFDEHVRLGLFVPSHIEVVPGVLKRHMTSAIRSQ
jgi:hypothetical protein